jgi:Xaa-Pro dipeptidase
MRIITPEKLKTLVAEMKSRAVDVLLVSDFEPTRNKNLRYLTGQPSDAHALLYSDGTMTLIPWDQVMAKNEAQVDTVLDVANFDRSYRAALVHALQDKLGKSFTLEVLPSEKHFTVLQVQEAFPGVKVFCQPDGADDTFRRLRAVKTPAEIAILKEGAKVTDEIINLIEPFIKSHKGLREIDLAIYMEVEMKKRGSEGPSFETLTANRDRSGMIHQVPSSSDAQLDLPGLALLDMGLWWKGYATDVTVPLIFGKLPPEKQKILDKTLEAYAKALTLIKPGALAHEVGEAAIAVIESAGLNMPYSLGHGIGLEVHDPPLLGRKPKDPAVLKYWKPTPLEVGMVFTVEPGVVGDLGGSRLENDVLVTETGVEVLTHSRAMYF